MIGEGPARSGALPHLEILDRTECLRLLHGNSVGRIVYTADALPAVEPVNYVVHDNRIIIRTESTSKLAAARRHDVVAFEIDDIDPVCGTGWSVVVTGLAKAATRPEDVALPALSWPLRDAGRYVRVSCDILTGRRLSNTGIPAP